MCYNPYSLEGKTILVTGASSGIGRATAIECSKMGAKLVITGRNADRLNETYSQLSGEEHLQFIADLTIQHELYSLVEFAPELDGFVNNAGVSKILLTQYINEPDLDYVLNINTRVPILLTQRMVKMKKMKKPSSIVFVSSISGVSKIVIGYGVYGSSKAAIHAFMQHAAKELASKGIRCNSVHPGMVYTEMIGKGPLTEAEYQADIKKYPLKRYGNPNEIAHAIIYLLSDAASWITGTALKIDGGISL